MVSFASTDGQRLSTLLFGGLFALVSMLGSATATDVDRRLSMIANARRVSVEEVAADPTVYTEKVFHLTEEEARERYGDIPPRPGKAKWSGTGVERHVNVTAFEHAEDRKRQALGYTGYSNWDDDVFLAFWDDTCQEDREDYCGVIACPNSNSGYSEGLEFSTTFSVSLDTSLTDVITLSLGIEKTVTTSEGFHAEVRGGDVGDPNSCCKRLWTRKNIQWHKGTLYKDYYRQYVVNGIPSGPAEKIETESTPNIEIRSGGLDDDGFLGFTTGSTACWDESAGCGDQTDFCDGQC